MALPESARLEGPILQELLALGGEERIRALYERLLAYFPHLDEKERERFTARWRRVVQRAGARLVKRGELHRHAGRWRLTERGRQRAEAEKMLVEPSASEVARGACSHEDLQTMLVEIGRWLGKHAEREYERYDVVWKESPLSPRLSHVFEIQVRGKLESALAKLKHAYDTQRSKPVLVIADARDENRARQWLRPYLSGSFHEIGDVTIVLSAADVERVHRALTSIRDVLCEILI
jgi:predicted RNA-binding protein